MAQVTFAAALNQALRDALTADERVSVFGEDVGVAGGVFRITDGIARDLGEDRCFDTPLAESGIVGFAVGMCMAGLRPVVEMQFDAFAYPAFEQITSHVAKMRNRTRGALGLPMVIRIPYAGGIGGVEHHCDSSETYYAHTPGLRVYAPATVEDAYVLLRAAIDDPDPVIFLEPKRLYWSKAEVDLRDLAHRNDLTLPGQAVVRREGTDVTLVAYGPSVSVALEAAEAALEEGWSVEVVDLRTLNPYDDATVVESVRRTGRCVVVQEAQGFGGVGAEIAARVQERAFHALAAPVLRVAGLDIPYPPPKLEHLHLPGVDRVLDAIARLQWDDTPDLRHIEDGAGVRGCAMTARTFLLPDLGEGLTEAEIIGWMVAVGDEVVVDQVIATVETAKAQVELPCPYAGVVATLHGEAGQILDVGRPLITVEVAGGAPGSSRGSAAAPAGYGQIHDAATAERLADERGGSGNVLIGYGTSEGPRTRRRRVTPAGAGGAPGGSPAGSQRAVESTPNRVEPTAPDPMIAPDEVTTVLVDVGEHPGSRPGQAVRVISPLVRKMAAEHGVDLRRVRPGAPGGIITKRDVQDAIAGMVVATVPQTGAASAPVGRSGLAAGAASPAGAVLSPSAGRSRLADERIPITGIRKVIADKLSASRREIPDATTWVDVDATGLHGLREDLRHCAPEAKIGYLALLARIVVAGLTRFPELNARVDTAAGEIIRVGAVHLSFAAQGPRGLVVPVVHHADSRTTEELAAELRGLIERARLGTLTPEEMTGGTFTLNNYGVYGVDGSTPIINHPEAGMLGVGRIVDKPWVVDGVLAVRPVTQLSLSFDHRVCDGGVAGGFLRYVADCVERPGALLAGL